MLRASLAAQPAGSWCVSLNNPLMTRDEFVTFLATNFQLSSKAKDSKAVCLHELEQVLRDRHAKGLVTALVIDEAQSLPGLLLEEVRLLANIETTTSKLLSLVLAGQPELAARLDESEFRPLRQRVGLRCMLRPLDKISTAAYMAQRIRIAGGDCKRVFTREAVELICEASKGIPRVINVIADKALLSGFAAEKRPVDRQVVFEVCEDFDLLKRPNATSANVEALGER